MKSPSNEIRRARPLLGTIVEIAARGPHARPGIEAAFREIEIVHRLMSFHEVDSDVSRINRSPLFTPVAVDPRIYEVLSWAQRISALSDGAFDVTVGAKLVAAGFLPAPSNSEWPCEKANFRDLNLLPGKHVLLKRRAWIDLGGIAKGYGVDRAVEALRQNGVGSGVVNAGGDLYVFGAPRPIHVRHPEDASRFLSLGTFADVAIASSSGCFTEHRRSGAGKDPLIDLRQNSALRWKQGVSVLASYCLIADALTKVVRLAQRRAPKILAAFGARAVVIDRRGIRIFQAQDEPINSGFPRRSTASSDCTLFELTGSGRAL